MKKAFLVLIVCLVGLTTTAQKQPPFTPAEKRLASVEQRKQLEQNSLFSNIEFRSVGPTVMSGRVVDIDVNPKDPTELYVAYASGGLWHTENNGNPAASSNQTKHSRPNREPKTI